MGFFLFFGLVYMGYSLVDWGHYMLKHEKVGLWYLISGLGAPDGGSKTSTSAPGVGPATPTKNRPRGF